MYFLKRQYVLVGLMGAVFQPVEQSRIVGRAVSTVAGERPAGGSPSPIAMMV